MTAALRIGLRVDASPEMSLGHLSRCLTLADALKTRGAQSIFLTAPSTAPWRDKIEARGHRVATLSFRSIATPVSERAALAHSAWLAWGWRADAEACLAALKGQTPLDWLIVDHYALDARWEEAMRTAAARILAIDDLADRPHACDVLLDHNAQDPSHDRYENLVPPSALRLIGPHFALLRPEFVAARARMRSGAVTRILLFMSATDPRGATLLALEALSQPKLAEIALDIVIGAASRHRAAIEASAAKRGRARVHVDVADMAALCSKADLAIGAGGVAALERCRLGLASLTLAIAPNQNPGLKALEAANAVRHLGALEAWARVALADAISALIEDEGARTALSVEAAKLVDGAGAARCADLLLELARPLLLRRADMSDAQQLHVWRNDETVRRLSLNTAPIAFEDHAAWLAAKLDEPNHFHYIAEQAGAPCGAIRFDIADGAARVSIVVAPHQRGTGLGARILAAGEKKILAARFDVSRFIADIRPENSASRRLFERAGYRSAPSEASDLLCCVKFAGADAG
jgi:UDP-2,4-diacetamido-2,4,6-trideoxy-beta-L-altropyranose hydrolase